MTATSSFMSIVCPVGLAVAATSGNTDVLMLRSLVRERYGSRAPSLNQLNKGIGAMAREARSGSRCKRHRAATTSRSRPHAIEDQQCRAIRQRFDQRDGS